MSRRLADPLPLHLNNFDALRLAAAALVLLSHHYSLTGQKEPGFLTLNTLGVLAVSIFFAISGYLVTQSWYADPHPVRFALRRILRIWPALTVLVVLTVCVLGLSVSTLAPAAYVRQPEVWAYFKTLWMQPHYYLPGVFTTNALAVVNGSLWTIPLEVQCYIALLLAGWAGALQSRQALVRLGIVYIVWHTVANRPEAHGGQIQYLWEMGAYFIAGAILQLTQQRWRARPWLWLAGALLGAALAWQLDYRYLAALLAVSYLSIWLGSMSTPFIRRMGRFGDFSYGIYLFAFPVQQWVLMQWYPALGFWASMAVAFALTLLCAVLSWHLVERPALALKPRRKTAIPSSALPTAQPLAPPLAPQWHGLVWGAARQPVQWLAATLAGVLLLTAGAWLWRTELAPPERLTFFSPEAFTEELAQHVRTGMMNVHTVAQLRDSLEVARRRQARLQLDFSHIVSQQRPPERLRSTYEHEGQTLPKTFAPRPKNKVQDLPDEAQLRQLLAPFLPVLQEYKPQIQAFFWMDEPYMHGISRAEMERLAVQARQLLAQEGLGDIPFGITFSSAMFDAGFARQVSAQAQRYVHGIEQYHASLRQDTSVQGRQAYLAWTDAYRENRLTTYDVAGNLYTDGGIPKGYQIVAYNLYTATLLQDAVHAHTLAWFADLAASAACARFKGMDMAQIRQSLSFYQDGPIVPGGYEADKPLLDAIFACKSESILHLLKQRLGADVQLQIWGESSANGFLEFDARGERESDQPHLLVAARVQDEVQRTLDFYDRHKADFGAGIVFFVWDDTVDHSIDLRVLGAKSMPGVTQRVFERISK